MGRRPTVELILAGVMVALIAFFVVWYGWLIRQIDTVGVDEMPTAGTTITSTTSAGTTSSTETPATTPTTGVPAASAPGSTAKPSGGGEEAVGKIGGLGGNRRMKEAGLGD